MVYTITTKCIAVGRRDGDVEVRGEHLFSLLLALLCQLDQAITALEAEQRQRKAA